MMMVDNVAVADPEFSVPLDVATTPTGTEVDHVKVLGFIDEDTVITAFAPEQIGPTFGEELATGRGLTTTVVFETAGLQGPAGSSVVKVRIAFPVKPAGGVQVELNEDGLEKVPPTLEVQVAFDAAPPMLPFNVKL
jgi:hypothetical protein